MRKFTFLITLFLSAAGAWGQEAQPSDMPKKLAQTGRLILEHPEYAVRDSANEAFAEMLAQYVQTPQGFNDSLKSVTNMMRLVDTEEGRFRIYTWQIPDPDYSYHRHGLIVVQTGDDYKVTHLHDKLDSLEGVDFRKLSTKEWPGALYYKIIPMEKEGQQLYTLLGYAPGEEMNRKIIELLRVKENGDVRFGGKVFRVEKFMDQTFNRPPMRLILKYNGKTSASVRWNEDKEMIVMDNLSPPDSDMKGNYRRYGPDFTYNSLEWKKDWWRLERDIKFETRQKKKIVPPPQPVGLPSSRDTSKQAPQN